MKRTGAVLLAAGMSSRMKEFKPLLPFGDTSIASHIVLMLKQLGVSPIVVVTGYMASRLEEHLAYAGVRFVRNERFQETEMFDSAVLGMEAIAGECERVMLMPMDVPAIKQETIRETMKIDAALVRTVCAGKPGHPVLIDGELLPRICTYHGDRGLRGAMEECKEPITSLEVEDEGIYLDVDTKEEYQALLKWNYKRGEVYPIHPQTQVKLVAEEPFFGPGVCQLLELVDQTGSIQEACLKMDISYSKGSRMIKNLNRQLGFPAVERWAGGSGGGGSSLTGEGKRLVEYYRKMEKEVQKETESIYGKYFGRGIQGL